MDRFLAAAFPADAWVQTHGSVIFADAFEADSIGGSWDEVSNPKGNVLSLTNPANAQLGQRCLRVEAHLGKDTGGGMTKWFESPDSVHIRFYVRFDKQCHYVHHFVTLRANKGLRGGDKWSGFGGAGLKPSGEDRFSTAIEPWGNYEKHKPPGAWNFYSYWHEMNMSGDKKYWGNSFMPDGAPDIVKEKWICVEFMLKHNTPGQRDGEQAYWIDGTLCGHWKGINWRISPTLKANALTLESYFTDRWTTQETNIVYFDNLVIAKQYIGPSGN